VSRASGLGLQAPAAVAVELRATERRVFRLTRAIGPQGLRLAHPAPFEIGQPVDLRLRLPDADERLELRAEVVAVDDESEREGAAGGCGLALLDTPGETRQALAAYVAKRLGLPALP